MIILSALLVALAGYTFVHPSIDNGLYHPLNIEDKIYRMNTRDGSFEECDTKTLICKPFEFKKEDPV
jgi:hypothetical protein